MDLEKRLEAQQAKSDVMSMLGPPEHGSAEAMFQGFVDKNYPPPSPSELVQEAKRRIMAEAGQVEHGSFEAKFQEFADSNFPTGGTHQGTAHQGTAHQGGQGGKGFENVAKTHVLHTEPVVLEFMQQELTRRQAQ